MKLPRLYISAAHKSSGKTTIGVGLCAALTKHGYKVQPFKKGPDYIDSLWLSSASLNSCYNLDFNTMSEDEILSFVSNYSPSADITIIEGNKGLYDGVDISGSDCNAAVAKLLKIPVILVLDAQGVTRGVAPLLLGYQGFDKDLNIAGVIFNKVASPRHESKLRQVTEQYTDIPILGSIRKSSDLLLVERHLGLMPFNESDQALKQIEAIADAVAEQVDLQHLINIAGTAKPLPSHRSVSFGAKTKSEKTIRIGVCKDASFSFYYEDDLEALENAGAELITINTLSDKSLPPIDGLFIGGGFPEAKMKELSANKTMRNSIQKAIENGLPTYAECGGLMYLSQSIIWKEKSLPMVGIIPGDAVMHVKPQGRGYVKLLEIEDMLWSGGESSKLISAHEFHYSKLENTQGNLTKKGAFAYSVQRGTGIDGSHDGWVYKNLLASYTHMRDTSNFHWATRFVQFIKQRNKEAL